MEKIASIFHGEIDSQEEIDSLIEDSSVYNWPYYPSNEKPDCISWQNLKVRFKMIKKLRIYKQSKSIYIIIIISWNNKSITVTTFLIRA